MLQQEAKDCTGESVMNTGGMAWILYWYGSMNLASSTASSKNPQKVLDQVRHVLRTIHYNRNMY